MRASISSNYCAFNRQISVLEPKTYQPSMEDVFRALPKINRFNGQTRFPYSVALHSVACLAVAKKYYGIKDPHLLLAILLHDAGEAYIGDIVRPIKQKFNGGLYELENEIFKKIMWLHPITTPMWKEIQSTEFQELMQIIDTRMAVTEADQLLDLDKVILPQIKRFNPEDVFITDNWRTDEGLFKAAYFAIFDIMSD